MSSISVGLLMRVLKTSILLLKTSSTYAKSRLPVFDGDRMHYYELNLGEFAMETQGLNNEQIGVYIRLVNRYASTEKPITSGWVALAFPPPSDRLATAILDGLFDRVSDGWEHSPTKNKIERFQAKAAQARAAGSKGGRAKAKASECQADAKQPLTECQADAKLTNNQEPITNNQDIHLVNAGADPGGDDGLFVNADSVDVMTQTSEKVDRPKGIPPCPYTKLVELYHRKLPELPQVAALSSARKAAMKARWCAAFKEDKLKTEAEGLDFFDWYFELVHSRPFLLGLKAPTGGRQKPWKATFDWIFKEASFLKVVEGNYKE